MWWVTHYPHFDTSQHTSTHHSGCHIMVWGSSTQNDIVPIAQMDQIMSEVTRVVQDNNRALRDEIVKETNKKTNELMLATVTKFTEKLEGSNARADTVRMQFEKKMYDEHRKIYIEQQKLNEDTQKRNEDWQERVETRSEAWQKRCEDRDAKLIEKLVETINTTATDTNKRKRTPEVNKGVFPSVLNKPHTLKAITTQPQWKAMLWICLKAFFMNGGSGLLNRSSLERFFRDHNLEPKIWRQLAVLKKRKFVLEYNKLSVEMTPLGVIEAIELFTPNPSVFC